jgi:hypothetical protein
MIASKSRSGLSVSGAFVEANVVDGKFIPKVHKARVIKAVFKEKIWNLLLAIAKTPYGHIPSSSH